MPREITICSCSVEYGLPAGSGPDVLRNQVLELTALAGKRGADIVCLPEFCASLRQENEWVPETIPGPATDAFSKLASSYGMYVLVPVVEDAGEDVFYNSVAVIDRRGQVIGSYRKTHLCLPDFDEGEKYSSGGEITVFQTDFGKIGITICMDIHYPELYGVLALRGAEIIFWPSAAMDYTGNLMESLANARAIDNQVYFVCSHYTEQPYLVGKHYGRSRIIDPMGRIRADTGHFPGIALATVDLDQTYPMWYQGEMLQAYPTMREVLSKTRRPELYGDIATLADDEKAKRA